MADFTAIDAKHRFFYLCCQMLIRGMSEHFALGNCSLLLQFFFLGLGPIRVGAIPVSVEANTFPY